MKGDDPNNPYFVFFTPEGIQAEFSFGREASIDPGTGTSIEENANHLLLKCNEAVSEFTVSLNGRNKTKVLALPKSIALQSYIVKLKWQKAFDVF